MAEWAAVQMAMKHMEGMDVKVRNTYLITDSQYVVSRQRELIVGGYQVWVHKIKAHSGGQERRDHVHRRVDKECRRLMRLERDRRVNYANSQRGKMLSDSIMSSMLIQDCPWAHEIAEIKIHKARIHEEDIAGQTVSSDAWNNLDGQHMKDHRSYMAGLTHAQLYGIDPGENEGTAVAVRNKQRRIEYVTYGPAIDMSIEKILKAKCELADRYTRSRWYEDMKRQLLRGVLPAMFGKQISMEEFWELRRLLVNVKDIEARTKWYYYSLCTRVTPGPEKLPPAP